MTDEPGPQRPVSRHADRLRSGGRVDTWRHPVWVRITHWLNVVAVVVLLMTGLNILQAHPHLYWGLKSTFADPWFSPPTPPGWMMLPSVRDLATARSWHFLFAWIFVLNGLAYLAWGFISRRFAHRLWPTRQDIADIPHAVVEHARFQFPKDDRARVYNVIQKLTYLAMILIVLPLMLITGLSMSPGFNAIGGVLLDLMGGRQSARTLHFIAAGMIVAFIIIHVGLVVWTGLFNNLRAMTTGWFRIEPTDTGDTP
jgi:thiosulfate reductase cytochrome b subunit